MARCRLQERDLLRITVTDAGPGFDPAILARLGKPYQSSKGRAGGGLGLFLVVNVARTVGGRVAAAKSYALPALPKRRIFSSMHLRM